MAVRNEFGLDPAQVAALPALGYLLMGVGALPVGLWVDAWGSTRVLFLYLLATAAAGVGVALAPTAPLLIVALTALGLALSIYHPAGLALLSQGVRARGRALGINGVAGSAGIAAGPLLGLFAADYLGSWRIAYFVLAGLALASAGVFWAATRPGTARAAVPRRPHPPAAAGAPGRDWWVSQSLLLAVMMLAGLNYRCLMMTLPTFLTGADAGPTDYGDLGALVLTFLVLLAGALGQYGGGWAADRFGAHAVYPLAIVTMVPLGLSVALLHGTPLVGACAGLLAVFVFSQQPMENSLLAEGTRAGRQGLSYGTKLALTFGVGALGTQVTGLIWQETGALAGVFYFIAATAVLMTLLAVAATRRAAALRAKLLVSR
jgi:MFS family permease